MRSTIGYGLEFTSEDITKMFPAEVAAAKAEAIESGYTEDDLGTTDFQDILEKHVRGSGIKTDRIDFEYSVDNDEDPQAHHVLYFPLHEGKAHYQGKISMLPLIPKMISDQVKEFKARYPIFDKYSWKLLFISDAEK